jgi:hypothetical protein
MAKMAVPPRGNKKMKESFFFWPETSTTITVSRDYSRGNMLFSSPPYQGKSKNFDKENSVRASFVKRERESLARR